MPLLDRKSPAARARDIAREEAAILAAERAPQRLTRKSVCARALFLVVLGLWAYLSFGRPDRDWTAPCPNVGTGERCRLLKLQSAGKTWWNGSAGPVSKRDGGVHSVDASIEPRMDHGPDNNITVSPKLQIQTSNGTSHKLEFHWDGVGPMRFNLHFNSSISRPRINVTTDVSHDHDRRADDGETDRLPPFRGPYGRHSGEALGMFLVPFNKTCFPENVNRTKDEACVKKAFVHWLAKGVPIPGKSRAVIGCGEYRAWFCNNADSPQRMDPESGAKTFRAIRGMCSPRGMANPHLSGEIDTKKQQRTVGWGPEHVDPCQGYGVAYEAYESY